MTLDIRLSMGWLLQEKVVRRMIHMCIDCKLYRTDEEEEFVHVIPPLKDKYDAVNLGVCKKDFVKYTRIYQEGNL